MPLRAGHRCCAPGVLPPCAPWLMTIASRRSRFGLELSGDPPLSGRLAKATSAPAMEAATEASDGTTSSQARETPAEPPQKKARGESDAPAAGAATGAAPSAVVGATGAAKHPGKLSLETVSANQATGDTSSVSRYLVRVVPYAKQELHGVSETDRRIYRAEGP